MTLLGLFGFRVVAQLVQAISPVSFLPSFDSWQSGTLPYWLLFCSQVLILVFLVRVVGKFRSGSIVPDPRHGLVFLGIGIPYLVVMLLRLLAGFTFAADHSWLGMHLPAVFHIVLALFLCLVGLFHSPHAAKIVAWTCYPVTMILAIVFHLVATHNDTGQLVAVYLPITVAVLFISGLEFACPRHESWQFSRNDLGNDLGYMALVQILLPRFLGFFWSLTLLDYLQRNDFQFELLWPGQWPVYAQALLMLVSADFLRYWLHRLSHNWKPLWVLHAVHHSPHKLYWANVSRFHPLEKSIQYLFDTLPFLLLGVSEQVLALYFVFYAINGFFQHCNINLHLGVLNYLISGPELHRWHHSREVSESNNNYGNNLIIWDLIFNSWFLPKGEEVKTLGLINRHYPQDLVSQLKSPFIAGLDKKI